LALKPDKATMEDAINRENILSDAKEKYKESKAKEEAEKAKKQIAETTATEKPGLTDYQRVLWKNMVFQVTWAITGLILNKVYDKVDESCKEEYLSSEPESNVPSSGSNSGGSGGGGGPGGDHGTGGACNSSNSTILTAQLYRFGSATPYTYNYTYTITACGMDVNYLVSLENTAALTVANGTVTLGNMTAGIDSITSSETYDNICVNVTDITVGKQCFLYSTP
jgi:hypothetical protein